MGSVTRAQDVKTNYKPGSDFSKYHAYKWVEIKDAQHPNQIVDAEIKQSVDSQMANKGFTKTDDDSASLYLGYTIAVDQEKQWNAFGTGGRRFGGMGEATSSTVSIGSLVLDMYDTAAKTLVWQGTVTETIEPKASPEKNQKNIEKAMQKLMKNFPPGRSK
jgi:hypothetical protein